MAKKRRNTQGEAQGTNGAGESKLTKMDAVRQALSEDPSLTGRDGADFVKSRFGLDMSPKMFASYRSSLRLAGKTKKRGRGAATAPAAAQERPRAERRGGADPVEAARAVKELVERYGAETVRGLVDLFGGE